MARRGSLSFHVHQFVCTPERLPGIPQNRGFLPSDYALPRLFFPTRAATDPPPDPPAPFTDAMLLIRPSVAFGFAPALQPFPHSSTVLFHPRGFVRRIRYTTHKSVSAHLAAHSPFDTHDDDSEQDPFHTNHEQHAPIANLHELTARISDLLDVGSLAEARATPMPMEGDERMGHLNASLHIVVVFGKRLIRDQVTVEYAKRIVTLVKQLTTKAIDPDMICFTGGRAPGGCVSEASAGYSFFRSVCEEARLDVQKYSYLLEEKSTSTLQNVQNVIAALQRRCKPEVIANCHFTLVSSDYHLIRLQEVHRINLLDSALYPLSRFSATWSYIFAAYPFCVSHEPGTAFLGRAIVLANDLSVVLVNLTSAVNHRRFVAKENLYRLQETFAKMRDMFRVIDSRSMSGFRTDMRKHAETLELAIHRVRELNTILLPMQKDGVTVSKDDMQLAQRLLMTVVRDLRESMDPDRVLSISDRVAVANDMAEYLAPETSRRHGRGDNETELQMSNGFQKNNAPLGHGDNADTSRLNGSSELLEMNSGAQRSELVGHGGARFAGNGKRISRDGPNIVILDEMATTRGDSFNLLDGIANTRAEPLSVLLDDVNTSPTTKKSATKRPRGRPAGSTRNSAALRPTTRATRGTTKTTNTAAPRKKRGRTPTKQKTPTSKSGDAD